MEKRKNPKPSVPSSLASPEEAVLPCSRSGRIKALVERYAEDLKASAHKIGSHGLSPKEFENSGLFSAAVERLRGQRAASMKAKRAFIEEVLDYLKVRRLIADWKFAGGGERHDYRILLKSGRVSIFEAKGCLDGNNTTIFQRPPDADEFFLWSLCQNAGSDPRRNAWSGVHTRLGGELVSLKKPVDGLIIWDMMCGTISRPCPKTMASKKRNTVLPSGKVVPPPCLYLFPRTVPDPRNNPSPPARKLGEVEFLRVLYDAFGCESGDVTSVEIEARMNMANVERRTSLLRNKKLLAQSEWTPLKRASR